jgi:hypothetical protein
VIKRFAGYAKRGGGGGGFGGGGEAVNRVNCGQENDEKWGNFCMV